MLLIYFWPNSFKKGMYRQQCIKVCSGVDINEENASLAADVYCKKQNVRRSQEKQMHIGIQKKKRRSKGFLRAHAAPQFV